MKTRNQPKRAIAINNRRRSMRKGIRRIPLQKRQYLAFILEKGPMGFAAIALKNDVSQKTIEHVLVWGRRLLRDGLRAKRVRDLHSDLMLSRPLRPA